MRAGVSDEMKVEVKKLLEEIDQAKKDLRS
jgi:hypothetical protein